MEPLLEEAAVEARRAARRTRSAVAEARGAAVQADAPVAHEAQAPRGAALAALRGQIG
jgi:hypothetical protein